MMESGKTNKDYVKLYSKLIDRRQKGDYGDLFDFTEEQVLPLIIPTQNLLNIIKFLIEQYWEK